MTPFEYVIVLISIILGLGIALVLTGVADLIKRWKTLIHFWPYLIWIALVFVLMIQEWWATYELKSMEVWSLPSFLFVLLYPILLFIFSNLIFPSEWTTGFNLRNFYFSNYTKFFVCVILGAILSLIQNLFISGYKLADQGLQIGILVVFTVLLLKPTENKNVHATLAVVLFIVMVGGLFLSRDLQLIAP